MSAALVCDADTPRPQWLAARREGIGASEIAAVLGISPWESPFSLYWRKREGWETEASDEMATGTRLEPAIAEWWHDTSGNGDAASLAPAGLYRSADRPWQMATPDRLIVNRSGRILSLLECKWTGSWDGWGQYDIDVPVHYRAQCLQQADVMGVGEVHVAVLGPSGFRRYVVYRDEGDADVRLIRARGAAWWAGFTAGIEPDIDSHTQTLAVVRRLHPDITEDEVTVTAATADGYRRAQALCARVKATKDKYAARLRREMAGARVALDQDGRKVASRSVNDRLTPPRSPK